MRKKLILILIITLLLFTGCKKSCKEDKNTNTPSKADEIMKNFEEYTINFTITNKDKVTEYFIIISYCKIYCILFNVFHYFIGF